MKKATTILFLICLVIFTSCSKTRNELRIRSSFSNDIKVKVGPNDYGTVKTARTTEYKTIPKGKHEISGDITGSIDFQARGKHYWTININSVGITTLVEDKK